MLNKKDVNVRFEDQSVQIFQNAVHGIILVAAMPSEMGQASHFINKMIRILMRIFVPLGRHLPQGDTCLRATVEGVFHG